MFVWGERRWTSPSLYHTSMEACGYVTFATAAFADDGVGDNSSVGDRLFRSGYFS